MGARIVPQRTKYHKIKRSQNSAKSSRKIERQLQLPLQPLLMRIKTSDNQKPHGFRHIALKILFLIGVVVSTLLISSAYHSSRFKDVSSNLSLKYEETHPTSIDDIIEAMNAEEHNALNVDDAIYKLYEETLTDDNHILLPEEDNTSVTLTDSSPQVVIVIDDMGINIKRTKDISSLKYPLTVSFLTYADNLKRQIANSKLSGQEIMAHLPMEPQVMQHFTPKMLTTSMSDKEVSQTLQEMLSLFPDIVAVNNHMGSKFTEDPHRMAIVMEELAKRNLIFLDSKTTSHSVGPSEAKRHGVKLAERNVFLDNKDNFDYIMGQLHQAEKIARSRGYVIAIGHPKAQTYEALKAWLPTLEEKGLKLVPLSKIVK